MNKSIVLGAAGLMVLSACATDPSQYPGTEGNRTREGAVAGAALGGVLGAITGSGSRGDDIVRGAVIGGVAGAVAGNIMDRQAAELRNEFSNGQIQVIRSGDNLIVRMPNALLFATDSASLNPTLRSDLRVLARSLNKYPQSIVTVTGHTDNTGSAAYNQDLSERRAASVARVLLRNDVSGARVRTVGAGESRPIATNQTAEGRQQNRRVDITITPTN
ncbi:MAG: OmpA family protein [Silicimonas sp.]|nr:OmpA family protein [Silicimonas sp.]